MIRWLTLAAVIVFTATLVSCSACNVTYLGGAKSCNSNPTLSHEWPSPDGRRKIVESRFDCPGWYALKLDVTNPDGTKSLLLDDRPSDQLRPNRWPDLKVEWKSASEVWVTYPARQDTTCISDAGGIQVHCLDAAVAR